MAKTSLVEQETLVLYGHVFQYGSGVLPPPIEWVAFSHPLLSGWRSRLNHGLLEYPGRETPVSRKNFTGADELILLYLQFQFIF